MAVNNTIYFLSNCPSQYKSNSSGVQIFECMDSYPGNVLIAFFILLNVAFMLPLNCWLLWLARRTGVASSDLVFFNLSVAEVIGNTCIFIYLLGATLNEKVIIRVSNYMVSMLIMGRPLFQTFFCVERFLAVVHPLVYRKYIKALKLKLLFVGLVWLIILVFGWFIMDSFPKIPKFYTGLFLAMLVVCTSCSVMILWVLKRPNPDGQKGKEGAHQQKRKAFVVVTVILITLVFGYGTVSCVIILKDQLPYDTYCLLVGLSWWTLVPSALVQPYLYLSKVGMLQCVNIH